MSLKKIADLKSSLLIRLTVLYATTFTVLAFIGFAVFYYQIYSTAIERLDDELFNDTQKFAELIKKNGLADVRSKILADAKNEDPNKEFFRILNTNAEILASTDMSVWGNVDHHRSVVTLINSNVEFIGQTIKLSYGDKARVITAVIGQSLLMQLGEILEETDEYLDVFRNLLAILIAAFVIVSAAIGWYLARRSLAGMGEVTKAAEDITEGNYDRRVEVAGQFREVERLGAAFNTMLDRIQNLLQSMQQINDNIAHDLRSPLARIRGIAEMTIVKNKDIEDYKEMAISTVEECDTLIDMINTMLDITEIEAGVYDAKMEPFDLNQLISEACELFRPIAVGKKIDLQTNLPTSLQFKGNRKRMQRIVTNLLENAIKYTPDNGNVAVTAVNEKGTIKIDFKDSGLGIAENDLPKIFQRFYRCDKSRSQGGVGLGLSLVKAYTQSMNGTIHVQSVLDQGSVFTLSFAAN
jgi:signal transduction histidine kinase